MRQMAILRTAALASALVLGLVGSASAVPIIPSQTIVSGNITFDNFICSSINSGPSCGSIDVSPHTSTAPPDATTGDFGIRLQANFTALAGQSGDVTIQYDAHITGGLFHDASLYYNGTPISSITETIFNLANNAVIGNLLVTNPPSVSTADVILTQDATNIRVIKDIAFQGVGTQAVISIIDQNYSQVPEPASLALFGSALVGLGLIGWRRNRRDPV